MILVLLAGLLGFVAALVGILGFGLPPLLGLALWAGSGPAAALLVALAALLRGPAGSQPAPSLAAPRTA